MVLFGFTTETKGQALVTSVSLLDIRSLRVSAWADWRVIVQAKHLLKTSFVFLGKEKFGVLQVP